MAGMLRALLKILFSRIFIVGFLLVLQLAFIVLMIWKTSTYSVYINTALTVISLLVVLSIVSKKGNPAYKLVWVIQILLFPLFGGLLYLFITIQSSVQVYKKKLDKIYRKTQPMLQQKSDILKQLHTLNPYFANQAEYLSKWTGYPVYQNTVCEYLSPGEKLFERMVEELEKAEHYIFMEYFIIEQGEMWDTILEILVRKQKQGVDVRVMYDAMGCLVTVPMNFYKKLRKLGIACVVFNPFRPVLSSMQNNRDHRKITVIDGHTAFTGGINLADEYINHIDKHGHWKDASIMLKGDGVYSFTIMFLQMWSLYNKPEKDYSAYLPQVWQKEHFVTDGFVQPYADSPLDDETTGELVYFNMMNKAKDYIYITTPYLIVDHDMITALTLAAKSGVDVRIITPHHWDKWFVHMTTRSYYRELLEAGVKIYEYSSGFIHSKTFVMDDEAATVGSINLDYRSLFLHFECGVWLYQNQAVTQVKEDFLNTLLKSQEITLQDCRRTNFVIRFVQQILQLFAPLM